MKQMLYCIGDMLALGIRLSYSKFNLNRMVAKRTRKGEALTDTRLLAVSQSYDRCLTKLRRYTDALETGKREASASK